MTNTNETQTQLFKLDLNRLRTYIEDNRERLGDEAADEALANLDQTTKQPNSGQ